MLISATITPPSPTDSLPPSHTHAAVEKLASALKAEGMEILAVTEFGVLVRASEEDFEHSLGVKLPGVRPFSAVAHPSSYKLRELAGRVEVSVGAVPIW